MLPPEKQLKEQSSDSECIFDQSQEDPCLKLKNQAEANKALQDETSPPDLLKVSEKLEDTFSSEEEETIHLQVELDLTLKGQDEGQGEELEVKSPDPLTLPDSIVASTFLGEKEFSLGGNPDLPKIRAEQIRNWLQFEKENGNGEESPRSSREGSGSPPGDFELDSLTLSTCTGQGGQVTTLTTQNGMQRKVRFLTDANGNLQISVFLTNADGEEEEQEQVIQLGPENELPEGMRDFPGIESQLAALVREQEKRGKKGDLVESEKILKELGVEVEVDVDVHNEEPPVGGKMAVPVDPSLLDINEDGGSSDTETMSNASCSSMIEVKSHGDKEVSEAIDENNNTQQQEKDVEVIQKAFDEQGSEKVETEAENSELAQFAEEAESENIASAPPMSPLPLEHEPEIDENNNILSAEPQETNAAIAINEPKLIEIELKPKITAAASDESKLASPSKETGPELQSQAPPTSSPHQESFTESESEQQLASLCIQEEPISAVALTIAKWESFSKKQRQTGAKVSQGLKGLGKLILPVFPQGMPPTPNSKPTLKGSISAPLSNSSFSTSSEYSHKTESEPSTSPGYGVLGAISFFNSNSSSGPGNSSPLEEEESIYAQPNSQAGTTMTLHPSASSLLRSYPKPFSKGEIVNWFKEGEIHRSGILLSYGSTQSHHNTHIILPTANPILVSWFFGLITRQQAESYLRDQPNGTFLVRISTRIWGYTLSYQCNNKTKHFLISAINPAVAATISAGPSPSPAGKAQMLYPFSPGGRYAFVGTNMTPYTSLSSLIRHHSHAPITKAGGEQLLKPCPGGPSTAGIEYVFK